MELTSFIYFIFLFFIFSLKFIINNNKLLIIFFIILSILFYANLYISNIYIILFIIIINYFIIYNFKNYRDLFKRNLLIIGIIYNFTFLFCFKYLLFFVRNVNYFLSFFSFPLLPEPSTHSVIGISFFTFIATGCLIDVYRNPNEKPSFLEYVLMVCFFPYILAGPIVRINDVMPQFKQIHKINSESVYMGLELLLVGYFKKCVIADNIGTLINPVFTDPKHFGFIASWIASFFFTIQIYCDFSGYTDIARGIGLLLGVKLPENFIWPYFSTSMREFWRRWHMTLSFWVRDYIYIPMGGNMVSWLRRIVNIMVSWLIIGLWHGANYNFIFWGIYNGLLISLESFFPRKTEHVLWRKFMNFLLTFLAINIGMVCFRCEDLTILQQILSNMFLWMNTNMFVGLSIFKGFPILAVVILPIMHWLTFSFKYCMNTNFLLLKMPLYARVITICVMITIVVIFSGETQRFIYFAF